jgi:O-glycosyl hydrolase
VDSNAAFAGISSVQKRLACLSLGWCLLAALMPSLAADTPAQVTATIHPSQVLVPNFEGWGTSLCWWAKVCGGYSNRDEYASLAFTSLKLNIVRYNIGGGENPGITNTLAFRAQIPGFEPQPGVWDWSADANQRWMLKRAVALGANRVVAFANSPPWWMTVSGSVTGSADGSGNNLKPDCEAAFAEYLATVIRQLTARDGVHFDLAAPLNEPSANWWKLGHWQEGCHVSADQQVRLINELRRALDAQKLSTGIDASEDNDERSAVNSLNAYGPAESNVTVIATHSYAANDPSGIRRLAARWHKPAWVSEYGDADASGLKMARRIHDDLTEARVSAWIYWQVVDSADGWGFLRNPLNGRGRTSYNINQKFYVMGQFSKFIRPGFQIIGVNDAHSLAAYHPASRTLVIVAVNDTEETLNVIYDLSAFATLPAQASGVRTTPTENWADIAPLAITNKTFSVPLIPKSVTTFTLSNAVVSLPENSEEGGSVGQGH